VIGTEPHRRAGWSVGPPRPEHEARWRDLFRGYCGFYKVDFTDEKAATVWRWINAPSHLLEGLIAVDAAGGPIGLAHFREMPRPLQSRMAGFLDDLFVDPEHRGTGVARGLIDEVARIGRSRDWAVLRWFTADDNYRARTLYDRVATRTPWLTYEIKL